MSACAGLGLDNLYIDITAEEVPILDGSSASFRLPAAKRRHRVAKRAQAFHARHAAGGGARGRGRSAQVGAPGAATTASSSASRSTLQHPVVDSTGPARRVRHGFGPLQPRHRARAHLRLHQGRGDDARQRPGAGRRAGQRHRHGRLPRCSTPTACATTTSSPSTRSWTPWATCTAWASPCWRPTARSARATRSTTSCCASCWRTCCWSCAPHPQRAAVPPRARRARG
jgi:hypothetical protein